MPQPRVTIINQSAAMGVQPPFPGPGPPRRPPPAPPDPPGAGPGGALPLPRQAASAGLEALASTPLPRPATPPCPQPPPPTPSLARLAAAPLPWQCPRQHHPVPRLPLPRPPPAAPPALARAPAAQAAAASGAQGLPSPRCPVLSSFSGDAKENFQRLMEHIVGDEACPFAAAVYPRFLRERLHLSPLWRDAEALKWLRAWRAAGGDTAARAAWGLRRRARALPWARSGVTCGEGGGGGGCGGGGGVGSGGGASAAAVAAGASVSQ
jgi:hypothetical protein